MDIDVNVDAEVDGDINSSFGCGKEVSKSDQMVWKHIFARSILQGRS